MRGRGINGCFGCTKLFVYIGMWSMEYSQNVSRQWEIELTFSQLFLL